MAVDALLERVEADAADETTALNTATDLSSSPSYGTLNQLASETDEETSVETNTEMAGLPKTAAQDDSKQMSANIWSVISVLLLGRYSSDHTAIRL
jgi:hypothetical protein